MSNKRILVTGSTGFAGRNICRFFKELGYDVTGTFRTRKSNREIPGVTYVRLELSDKIEIEGDFEAIIHTACSHQFENLSVLEYVRDNVLSAKSLVEFAREKGIRTIIYFSTRSVYGQVRVNEVFEDNDNINPDIYGLTKYLGEKAFEEAGDLNTIGLRFPGIIGAGAHDIWLKKMTDLIRNNEDITVSDYDTKNLCWIGDVSKFIELLIKDSSKGNKFKYSVVNMSCNEKINNQRIVNTIIDRFHSKSKVSVIPPSPELFALNCDKAMEMGYNPSKPIDIVNWYLDTLDISK